MGEVYRAADTKLGRDVALKVLPAQMAGDPERLARFQREARAVAALNHPHIVTIFSVEEAEGVQFLTMELVEGKSLDHLIPDGGLAVERIVEVAGALAEALAAAHEKNIVHRDLKPANVMVTHDGRVKVLDFGLAKDVRPENSRDATMTSAGVTQAGMVMGTPAYMSPEQISGRALDHRTDIFSLGVVLYEMATGKQPFHGQSSAELISAILRDTVPLVTEVRADLPADLARIIRRCLEKDPRHRMQTARDIANEFRDLARQLNQQSSSATSSRSRAVAAADSGATRADEGFWVAVLPFKYSGGNADLIALAEGLTEDIVTGLARFSYLRVIARGSTAKYASESRDVRVIGQELGARYVLEGSLRQAGTKLRLSVQLVEAVSGAHLWAENYERIFLPESLFELQDDLVPRIVSTLADRFGVLPRSMTKLVRSKTPEQLTPYEAVLRSFAYAERATPDEHAVAKQCMELAVQRAPDDAECWATRSMLCRDEIMLGFNPRPNSLDRAFSAARRAVELEPSNHRAHFALAGTLFFRRELESCRNEADRAIALNPMDGSSIAHLGQVIALSGEWERGLALAERAAELNPQHPGWYWLASMFNAYRIGEYRKVPALAQKSNLPEYWLGWAVVAAAYGQLGETEAAAKAVEAMFALRPDSARIARAEMDNMFDSSLTAVLLDGLQKAGFEIDAAQGGPALTASTAN